MTALSPAILFIQVERTYSDGNRQTELLCTRFDVLDAVIIVEGLDYFSREFADEDEPSHETKILNISSVPDPYPEDANYFNALEDRVPSLESELFIRGTDIVVNQYRSTPGYESLADDIETMFRNQYPDYMARRDAEKAGASI
jgi:hypothetical protein